MCQTLTSNASITTMHSCIAYNMGLNCDQPWVLRRGVNWQWSHVTKWYGIPVEEFLAHFPPRGNEGSSKY